MRKYLTVLAVVLSASSAAWAVPETVVSSVRGGLVGEYLALNLRHEKFARGDSEISYSVLRSVLPFSRGTIVFSPGRTESVIGFSELIFDLAFSGFDVVAIDHRGQGYSQRELTGDIGYVRRFDDYVKDFTAFMDSVVRTERFQGPYYLLANSMGATIASFYMIDHPETFKAAALTVPMFRINTRPFTPLQANLIAYTLEALGRGKSYAPSRGPYNWDATFENQHFTHSRARFDLDLRIARDEPSTVVGGPSVNWVFQTLKATKRIRKNARDVKTPLVIFQAGQDQTVMPDAQDEFCARAAHCSLVKMPESFHGMLLESDSIRQEVLGRIIDFFSGGA